MDVNTTILTGSLNDFDRFHFTLENGVSSPLQAGTKQLQVYKRALTDQELIKLTSN